MKLLQTSPAMESSTTVSYPQRPEQPDCAYYLRCGSCKYGANCRFNHPILDRMVEKLHIASPLSDKGDHPDRPGQPDCQFYMKTGTCKFGINCKYHHPHQQDGGFANGQPQLNFVGLPIRPGEKECAFYLRTGSCKFGAACRFHHPERAPYGSVLPFSTSMYSSGVPASPIPVPYQSGLPSWQVNGAAYVPASGFPGSSAYMPVFVPPQQTISLPVWNAYQGQASFMLPPGGQQQAYAKSVYVGTSSQQADATAGTTDAHLASKGSSTGASWHAKTNLPERQGQPDCHYFMKTGHCKFGANCRYHHPKIAALSTTVLSVMGLPLRQGMPVCTFYLKNGICKYGPTCKFDHPIGPEYVPSTYTAPPTFPTVSSSSSIMSESLEGGSRDIITPGSSEESRDASKVEKEKVHDVLPSVKENGDCVSTISVDDSKDEPEALAQRN